MAYTWAKTESDAVFLADFLFSFGAGADANSAFNESGAALAAGDRLLLSTFIVANDGDPARKVTTVTGYNGVTWERVYFREDTYPVLAESDNHPYTANCRSELWVGTVSGAVPAAPPRDGTTKIGKFLLDASVNRVLSVVDRVRGIADVSSVGAWLTFIDDRREVYDSNGLLTKWEPCPENQRFVFAGGKVAGSLGDLLTADNDGDLISDFSFSISDSVGVETFGWNKTGAQSSYEFFFGPPAQTWDVRLFTYEIGPRCIHGSETERPVELRRVVAQWRVHPHTMRIASE